MTTVLRPYKRSGIRARMAALCLVIMGGLVPARAGEETLESVLARMDRAAPSFKSLTAQLRRVSHTAVINEDTVDAGAMSLKRSHHEIRMLVQLTDPDPKSVALHGDRLEIYYPKIQTVEEYDVGKNRALVEEFLLIGFGSSGGELSAAYQIKVVGQDTVANLKTTRLELIPKSKEVLQHLKKLEIWVPDSGMYPVQQKFIQPAGDYMLVTYTNVKMNPPLSDADLKLKTPRNAKRVTPQR